MNRRTSSRRKPTEDGPPRAVIYTRLSRGKTGETRTEAKRNTEVSLDTQCAGCEKAVAALDGTVVAVESDVSAGDRLDNRIGLFRAIERIETGDADTLIVYSLERLARDAMQQHAIVHTLRRAGGRLLSATETVEDGPLGDLMRAVYAFGGAFELAKTRERVNRALDAKYVKEGRYRDGPRPPYGYRRVGNGADATYEIEPTEAAIVHRVYAERIAGASIRSIILGLRRDGIPTSMGRGQWGTHTVGNILSRTVYHTGEHECWRTMTERDVDGVPVQLPRPTEERYIVKFPPIIDHTTAERAATVGERNRWKSNRLDRTAEFGIGRYGFFKCGGCGRALTVVHPKRGHAKYACSQHAHLSRPCPAPTSISVDKIDDPVWWWMQSVISDPARADAWMPESRPAVDNAALIAALREAEARVAELEGRCAQLTDNLSLLSGTAATRVAAKLTALTADLDAAIAERDRLADEAAQPAAPPIRVAVALDALAEATKLALDAMREAEPKPTHRHTIAIHTAGGLVPIEVPDSWKAKRAAMNALGVAVVVHQEASTEPRWVAEMRIASGPVIRGASTPEGWFSPDPSGDFYLSPTTLSEELR